MQTRNLIIRHAEPEDVPGMWPIIEDHSDQNKELFVCRVLEKRLLADHYIPVALLENQVLGYAWVHDYGPHIRTGHSTARLNDLFVSGGHRRKGVGHQLFQAVKSWCDARQVRWLQWQSSAAGLPFYESLGFKGDSCPDPEHPFFEIEFSAKKKT